MKALPSPRRTKTARSGVFVEIPQGMLPWRQERIPRRGPGVAAGACPCRSASAQGIERRRAVWTCTAGEGRVRLTGVPRGDYMSGYIAWSQIGVGYVRYEHRYLVSYACRFINKDGGAG